MQKDPAFRIGPTLRAMRHHLELSQEALALSAGVSKRTVEAIEQGSGASPRDSTLRSLCNALGADETVFGAAAQGKSILALTSFAPLSPGDFQDVLATLSKSDVVLPTIPNIDVAALARDIGRFFEQLIDTYSDVSAIDQIVYLRDLCETIHDLRAKAWIVRAAVLETSSQLGPSPETIGVLRFAREQDDRPTVFIVAPDGFVPSGTAAVLNL